MSGFVNDGTAINMGDPSSMRDQGSTRNCIYNAVIKTEPDFVSSRGSLRSVQPYNTYMRRDGPTNNGFYSFGGSKPYRIEAQQGKHLLNPYLIDYDNNLRNREVITYSKDSLVPVNDYTKNISQSIFSPGALPSNKFIDKQHRAQ